jgi:hypothetical protein
MDNAFLQYLLCLCLALILIVYLYQNNSKFKKNKAHPTHNNNNNNTKTVIQKFDVTPNHLELSNIPNQYTIFRNTGMPIHRVGPVINFHQHFNKYTTNPTYTTVKGCGTPTGIPELGWRNMYISNYTKNEIKEEDPFSGIVTRNYLDNMQNVDNIYRK